MKKYSIFFIVSFILSSCWGGWNKEGSVDLTYGSTRVVTASWYGPKFHGRRTASGETFNMHNLTCAHKTLPFGTKLQVTNLTNERSVRVIVNDRGPFVRGRELDLSYGAAKRIGLFKNGIGRVKITHLGRDMTYKKDIKIAHSLSGPYTIQIGSFNDLSNARQLLTALEYTYSGAYLMPFNLRGEKFYRVRLGKYKDKKEAINRAKKLAYEGYPVFITPIQ